VELEVQKYLPSFPYWSWHKFRSANICSYF